MGGWAYRSEQALATIALGGLAAGPKRVLIGGLGMGFTLGAALSILPQDAEIAVAELVPQVAAWARGHIVHLFGGSLDDPHVSVVIRDAHDVIDDRSAYFDAILLDVDNVPDGVVQLLSDGLYCAWGPKGQHTRRCVGTAFSPSSRRSPTDLFEHGSKKPASTF